MNLSKFLMFLSLFQNTVTRAETAVALEQSTSDNKHMFFKCNHHICPTLTPLIFDTFLEFKTFVTRVRYLIDRCTTHTLIIVHSISSALRICQIFNVFVFISTHRYTS